MYFSMKNTAKKAISLLTLVTLLVMTSPVSASSWSKVVSKTTSKKTAPVTQPVVTTQPTKPSPAQPQPRVQDTQMTPMEMMEILSQYLTQEQIEQLLELVQGAPYYLSEEQLAALIDAAKQFAQGVPYVLTDEQFAQVVEAVKQFASTYNFGQYGPTIENLIETIEKTIEENNLANSEQSREYVKALLLIADQTSVSYAHLLATTGMDVSDLSDADKVAITARLNEVPQLISRVLIAFRPLIR